MSQRRNSTARATRRMVTCAILSALSVVFLGVGAVIEIADLSAACAAAMVILLIYLTYGPRYALLSYAVTGVLAAILMPQSIAVWTYIGLVGYYPVIRQRLDRLPRLLAWLVKLALFAVVMVGCLLIFHLFFRVGQGSLLDSFTAFFGEGDSRAVMAWAVVGLSLFTFVLFDLLLARLVIIYELKWKKQVEKWMKP